MTRLTEGPDRETRPTNKPESKTIQKRQTVRVDRQTERLKR